MKVPGSIYIGKRGRLYLALYNFFPDIYRAALPSAINSEYIAHVDYGYDSFRRGIDVFLLGDNVSNIYSELDFKRYISLALDNIKYIDHRNDIKYEIIGDYRYKNEILNLIRRDIRDFCKNEAKKVSGTKIEYVDEIKPKIIFRKIKKKQFLQGGKQEYVPSCSLEANLDFSEGCVSGMVNGFLDIFAECGYCYALQNHKTFSKYIVELEKDQLKHELKGNCCLNGPTQDMYGKHIEVLRLGKRTETGSKFTLDSLVLTLETCNETKTRVIMPTKYLEFNKEIANLLKRTESSLLYDYGYDELERGACSYG